METEKNMEIADGMKSITLPWKTYIRLRKDACKLAALENMGVDGWDGYDYAMETCEDYLKDEGLLEE